MNDSGFISLNRELLNNKVFASEKRLKVWIWLLLKAAYKDHTLSVKTGKGETIVNIKRGQVLFGRYSAERELSLDGSTIYKILKWMEKEEKLVIESNSHYSIVTVSNYNAYQKQNQTKVAANVTSKEQPSNNQVTHTIRENKYNNDNKHLNTFCKKWKTLP